MSPNNQPQLLTYGMVFRISHSCDQLPQQEGHIYQQPPTTTVAMESELTKIQWLELLENTLVTRDINHSMDVILKNYNGLYSFLNSDEVFKNSFLTL